MSFSVYKAVHATGLTHDFLLWCRYSNYYMLLIVLCLHNLILSQCLTKDSVR